MTKERIEWIDSLKGFAISCVVLGHVVITVNVVEEHQALLKALEKVIYSYHMPLFFMISGMTFSIAYGNSESGERRNAQALNLAMLYVIWSVMTGLVKYAMPGYVSMDVKLTDLLCIFWKPIGPQWYLYVLAVFYLLFGNLQIRHRAAALVVLLAVSMVSAFPPMVDVFLVSRLLYHAFFFYIGMLFMCDRNHILFSKPATCSLTAMAVILMAVKWNDAMPVHDTPVLRNIVALGFSLMLSMLFSRVACFDKRGILNYLGKNSLPIYLIHHTVTTGSRTALAMLGLENGIVCVLLSFGMSMLIPLIVVNIAKRIGLYTLLFNPIGMLKPGKRHCDG